MIAFFNAARCRQHIQGSGMSRRCRGGFSRDTGRFTLGTVSGQETCASWG